VTLGKDGRPSEANHGNVTPSLSDRDKDTGDFLAGGVTIDHAMQTIVLSLPALRRLRFPINGNAWKPTDEQHKRDNAARTVLAALGLCSAALADESGLDLRSRCLLYPDDELTWELLDRKAGGTFKLPADEAVALFHDAVDAAKKLGLPWREQPLVLTPSEQLVKLVVKSQGLAVQQAGGEEGGE
jgi:CRISPR-associated protein Csb1